MPVSALKQKNGAMRLFYFKSASGENRRPLSGPFRQPVRTAGKPVGVMPPGLIRAADRPQKQLSVHGAFRQGSLRQLHPDKQIPDAQEG